MRKILFLLLAACFVAGCTTREGELSKLWFYSYSEEDNGNEGTALQEGTALSPSDFLDLQENGTYTSHLQSFDYGRWKVENDRIVLQNHRAQTVSLPIRSLDGKELVLGDAEGGAAYRFDGFSNKFDVARDNPFARENNLWRIRATRRESEAELTARLRNHFRFWEKYFNWALKTGRKTLDVRSLPSSIKIYGNGLSVLPYKEQSPVWKSYFYDSTDSRRAYEKTKDIIRSKKIAWPQTDHMYKKFLSAFQQLQRNMD